MALTRCDKLLLLLAQLFGKLVVPCLGLIYSLTKVDMSFASFLRILSHSNNLFFELAILFLDMLQRIGVMQLQFL